MNCEIDSSVGHMNSEGPITSVVHVTAWLAHLEAVDGGEGDAGEVVGAVPGLEQRAQRPDLGLVGRQDRHAAHAVAVPLQQPCAVGGVGSIIL